MKRPPPNTDCESSTGSKRRRRTSTSEDDDCSRGHTLSTGYGDAPPLHKIYNSSCRKEKPDELFRKDLISAMKLPDNEQLDESEFWDVTDTWKQEWERGVQVPVNSKNVPNPEVRILRERSKVVLFKQPKKLIRTTEDDFFSNDHHVLTDTGAKAEKICKYDMDDLDLQWLILFNEFREDGGKTPIKEETMELVLEDFELQCSNGFQDALKTEKGLGIEYDENVVCDVCRARENEDGNEMVFCDICNICVHQACYGIMAIPEGSWVCRPCALNIKPPCVLCPNSGGAMKSTSSGEKWAHVSCALWIPEVSIGCPEKMEPIMRISQIPTSRWALICSLCRERVGACIQCSVKQCKVAYHVTCAIENGLEMEMKTTPIDSSEEGVKMQSFCSKHSKTEASNERNLSTKSPRKRKKKKGIDGDKNPEDEVDEHNARLQKIRSLEAEFFNYVNIKETVEVTKVDYDVANFLYYYWLLKRKAKFNKPLLITKCDEANLLIKQHENLLYSRLKMFVHLRQDLERVRNLCYMISRREKIFRSYLRVKSDVFEKQLEILNRESKKLTPKEIKEIIKCRAGDNIYDKYYCVPIDDEKEEILEKESAPKLPNPYSKSYSNNIHTRSRRHTTHQSSADNYDTDSRDMPVLVKCKSEENVSATGSGIRKQPILTHSPFVIKIESKGKKENETIVMQDTGSNSEAENLPHNSETPSEKSNSNSKEQSMNIESNDHDTLKGSFENIGVKTKKPSTVSEISNDKNSLCLSDKENISAQKPVKIKKTRSQSDLKHSDFKNSMVDIAGSKPDLFIDENTQTDISGVEMKKNFKIDRRSTRYQTRTRCHSSEIIQENDEVSLKSSDSLETCISHPDTNDLITPPSNHLEEMTFISDNIEQTISDSKTPPEAQKRKRGRPRKVQYDIAPDENLSVIKKEILLDEEKSNICEDIIGLSDSNQSSFRMSLRNAREQPVKKSRRSHRRQKKRAVIIELDHQDTAPLKEANLSIVSESTDLENEGKSSPDWDSEDTRPPRLTSTEPPASTRIIIRLRKDPNRESWKNDSSSSSDVPAAFHIVRNDHDTNSESCISEFPSKINGGDSPDSQEYEAENKHRYSMRERTVTHRNVKCTFSKS